MPLLGMKKLEKQKKKNIHVSLNMCRCSFLYFWCKLRIQCILSELYMYGRRLLEQY